MQSHTEVHVRLFVVKSVQAAITNTTQRETTVSLKQPQLWADRFNTLTFPDKSNNFCS